MARKHHHQDDNVPLTTASTPSRPVLILAAVAPAILTILAFIFTILVLTSKDWARRDFFDLAITSPNQPLGPPPEEWSGKPLYTEYRSPFKICTNLNPGATNVTCFSYRPYGFNKTSCELAVATQDNGAVNYGDARLCQQIHFAGNLTISTTVFITLALLLVLAMTGLSILQPTSKSTSSSTTQRSALFSGLNIALIAFLALAAIQLLLAQSYGIQAFIQSQPDNGDFASGSASSPTGSDDHNAWVQGKALSIWASIAWLSAGLAVGTGTLAWGLPGRVVA